MTNKDKEMGFEMRAKFVDAETGLEIDDPRLMQALEKVVMEMNRKKFEASILLGFFLGSFLTGAIFIFLG